MAGEDDPYERYFRARPGGPDEPSDGVGPQDALVPVAEDSGTWDAVAMDERRAPRVEVTPPASHRRRGVSAQTARRRRRTLMITASMSAMVLLGSGGAWAARGYVTGKVKEAPVTMDGGRGPKGAMNILLAGVDKRDGMKSEDIQRLRLGREAGARSDTMMLVHISKDHDKVTVVSLPRDSLVTIPAHKNASGRQPAAQGKLTWAYSYGGAQLMKDTIQDLTGVTIDHYVEVNFLGFLKVVDAVGGVKVCTSTPIDDKASGLRLSPGTHHVDGAKALAFARARHGLGEDIGRMDRQQQFMSALLDQAKTIKDPVKAARFLNATLEAVTVDKGLKENITELADQFKDISLGSVQFAKVPIADPAHSVVIGGVNQSTVLLDTKRSNELFKKIDNDEPLAEPAPKKEANPLTVPPEQILVRVRNGVGTTGIAKAASSGLSKVGFRAMWVTGVVQRTDKASTIIRYGPARTDSARTLAASIPGAKLKKVDSLGTGIEVIVGTSWKKPKSVKVAGSKSSSAIESKTATEKLCK